MILIQELPQSQCTWNIPEQLQAEQKSVQPPGRKPCTLLLSQRHFWFSAKPLGQLCADYLKKYNLIYYI